jgi:cell filamentation protein
MPFDVFGDFETHGHLRNHLRLKDPDQIRRAENGLFIINIRDVLSTLSSKTTPLDYQDILDVHRHLFGAFYPWAGQDRQTTAPNINISKGGYDDLFIQPQFIQRVAEYALTEGQKPDAMRHRPGTILTELAHAHPFLDGNGRVITTIHAELCRRQNIHLAWEKTEKEIFLNALTRQMRQPTKDFSLDDYLRPFVREGALSLGDMTQVLQTTLGRAYMDLSEGLSGYTAQFIKKAEQARADFLKSHNKENREKIIHEVSESLQKIKGPSATKIPLQTAISEYVIGDCEGVRLIELAKQHDSAIGS